ncbi:MAG: YqgE/AlgH family protein [Burkholderiales bacterium]
MRRAAALLLALWVAVVHAGAEDDGDPVLLIAHPAMPDPNFAHSVVAVGFPQDSGPMGVILNHPSPLTLGQLFAADRPALAELSDTVFFGGPVMPDGILFVFRAAGHPVKALPLGDDWYLSGDGAVFERLVADPATMPARRFFAGYAGWAEGQLEREVARGDWYVMRLDTTVLGDADTATLWERLLQRAQAQTAALPRPTAVSYRPARDEVRLPRH